MSGEARVRKGVPGLGAAKHRGCQDSAGPGPVCGGTEAVVIVLLMIGVVGVWWNRIVLNSMGEVVRSTVIVSNKYRLVV